MSVHKDKTTGKWYAQAYFHDWQGQQQRKFKRGFDTKKEAQDWEREYITARSDDLNMTFAQFFEVYAEDRKPRLKYNTWLSKEYVINDKLIPYFGDKAMNAIDAKDIIRWQNLMIQSRDNNGKPYKDTHLKCIHNQLTAIFTHAFKYYGLKTNPASKAGSMGKKHSDEMQFWTRDEYAKFAVAAMGTPRVFYPFEVLYWCGLRLGELLALTYGDIDLDRKTIHVNKSYQKLKGKEYITDPKTPKSKRTIVIPDNLCNELREFMGLQYGFKMGDRMFSNVSKSYLAAHLKQIAEAVGIKPIRVHDLRHSHVSLLIELGFTPVAIAERVGHESIEITLRYAHLFPTKQTEMAMRLNAEMGEARHES
jgi:integrase